MRMLRQLGREDWLLAGLQALAREGEAGLRVEAVARGLGVTKGSFYWHFRDRAGWRQALLDWWEHRAFADLAKGRTGPRAAGPHRAAVEWAAVEWAVVDRAAMERAIRQWARGDLAAARCLSRVLRERALAAGAGRPARGLPS